MKDRRPKNLGLCCAVLAFIVLVVYPLSLGSWMWFCVHVRNDYDLSDGGGFYSPLLWITREGPNWIGEPYGSYLRWWIMLGLR